MQDKKKFYKILGNKNFQVKVFKPFNKLCIEFLEDFSKELKTYKNLKLGARKWEQNYKKEISLNY